MKLQISNTKRYTGTNIAQQLPFFLYQTANQIQKTGLLVGTGPKQTILHLDVEMKEYPVQ